MNEINKSSSPEVVEFYRTFGECCRILESLQVSWDSSRSADEPLMQSATSDPENEAQSLIQHANTVSAQLGDNDRNPKAMTAGQLIIYDLDEEPPVTSQREEGNKSSCNC